MVDFAVWADALIGESHNEDAGDMNSMLKADFASIKPENISLTKVYASVLFGALVISGHDAQIIASA